MKAKKLFSIVLAVLITTVGLVACTAKNTNNAKAVKTIQSKRIPQNNYMTPTFFFHGFGSSVNAEKHMVNAAQKRGVTHSIMTAIVQSDSSVKLSGRIARHAKNPIVMVGYRDNRNGNFNTDARYAYNAIKAVQNRYGFRQMNLVRHSMGNMDIMFLLRNYGKRRNFPILRHQVDLAGHFNGIRGIQPEAYSSLTSNGRPRRMEANYRTLLKLRKTYPKTASVMNIYGDLRNGTRSDGDVPVNSARSLKYLVSSRARHYEEHEIVGKAAQHSRLHRNNQVDNLLIKFIWNK